MFAKLFNFKSKLKPHGFVLATGSPDCHRDFVSKTASHVFVPIIGTLSLGANRKMSLMQELVRVFPFEEPGLTGLERIRQKLKYPITFPHNPKNLSKSGSDRSG